MVYLTDAQTFFEQSKLLLKARPSTTKISTKYTLPKPTAKLAKSLARRKATKTTTEDAATTSSSATTAAATPAQPKAVLTLRTYDPVSGTVLKYQTDKQAEVGRLIAGLGRCARTMAALPDEAEGVEGLEGDGGAGPAPAVGGGERAETPVQGQGQGQGRAGGGGGGGAGGGGGGGKKKKKNKK